jgi:hypothetical protein
MGLESGEAEVSFLFSYIKKNETSAVLFGGSVEK